MKTICKQCSRKYEYDSQKGHNKIYCNSCVANAKKHAVLQKCLEYKGGRCIKCGYNKCSRSLHFHHRDPKTKSFTISGNFSRKWETIKNELDKCDLVCANCHGEIHAVNDTAHLKIWIPDKPAAKINRVCLGCQTEFETYKRDPTVYCSKECYHKFMHPGLRPTKEQLEIDLEESKGNLCAIGRKYKVSDNAVRKWISKYGISSHT